MSRREFLASSAMSGIALGLPGLVTGCGSDDDSAPNPQPCEQRTFHFDLSFAEVSEARLRVLASPDDRMVLTPHDAASRARHRKQNPLLRDVADARLTHFAESVDLPADALQHFWITGRHDESGADAILGLQIHVPQAVRRSLAAMQRVNGQRRIHPAKVRAYGLEQVAEELTLEDLSPMLDEFVTPWDAATALVFHHPDIMNLNVEQGAAILDMIQMLPCSATDPNCMPFLNTLAFHIANHWPATTQPGGWATLVQVIKLEDDQPAVDEEGKPVYRWDLSDDTIAAAKSTIRNITRAIFNDPRFAGNNWHDLQGQTAVRTQAAESRTVAQSAGFEVMADNPPGSTVHGVEFVEFDVTDQAARTVQVGVKNHFMRSHSVYVEFANEAGSLASQQRDLLDSERAQFHTVFFTNDTVLGIPLTGDLVETQRVSFNVPPDATKALVHFGSLGVGGDPFCPEAVYGSILTLAFNLGIPSIFLAIGATLEIRPILNPLVSALRGTTQPLRKALVAILGKVLLRAASTGGPNLGRGIYASESSGSAQSFLLGLADLGLQFLFNAVPPVAGLIAAKAGGSAAMTTLGPFYLAVRLLSVAAVLSEIVQSVAEVLSSPAQFTNTLSLVMNTTVRIEHDPTDFRFPARARNYEVTLIYDEASKLAHKKSGTIAPAQVDPISVVFDKVPSGGKVTVDVVLTTDEGYIVGRSVDSTGKEGPVGPIDNTPQAASTIVVPIKERLIPLTQNTRYMHDIALKYQGGHRVWVAGPAPSATRAVLCQAEDDRLCNLGAITVNQSTGMAGYSFEAGGQADRMYCDGNGSGVMYLFQNVFLGQMPEQGLKVVPCGFRHPAGIVYERLGTASGRHFFLEPTPDGQSFFLESVLLDTSTPFTLNNPVAWGRFTQALESLAVVPTGYVVGVSRLTHKMEILQLPAAAVDRANAPEAVPFAVQKAGEGTREGLLSAPVGVAVLDATILVLETGNARIQAFDVSGNPVRMFKNGTSATVELEKTASIEYLDIAVEGLGYMYVLSATNDGLTVNDYRLDVLTPQGNLLARTTGVAAARLAVDTFRNVYTLNYETLADAPRVEPSLSQWVPSTPG